MLNKFIAGLLVYTLAVTQVIAQTATLVPNAKQTFLGTTGAPLAQGTVTYYVPGSTNKKTTWLDAYQASANTNPVVLDSAGRGVMFGQGNYRQVVKDKNGVQVWDSFTSAVGSSVPSGATGTDTAPVGTVLPYSGFSVPTNWQLAYGQAVSRTTFSDLKTAITIVDTAVSCTNSSTTLTGFVSTAQMRVGAPIEATCISTGVTIATIAGPTSITVSSAASATNVVTATVFPWGNGDGVSTFNVPDLRGRIIAGPDAMGGTAASRLTTTYYGASASPPAVAGGSQSAALAQTNLPSVNFVVTGSANGAAVTQPSCATPSGGCSNGSAAVVTSNTNAGNATIGSSTSSGINGFAASGGSATPFSTIQPTLTVNYMIKMAPNTTGAGGVVSIGGMFGDIVCDSTLTCAPLAGINTIGCTAASTSQLGCVEPDGTSTVIIGGKLSAIGGVATQVTVGTTGVSGGTNGYVLYNNAGVLGNLQPTGSGLAVFQTTPSLITPSLSNPAFSGTATGTAVIPNSLLVNSFTTVNGQTCILGGSCTASIDWVTVQDGTFNEAANRTFNPDCTWNRQNHKAQPANGFVWVYVLPSIQYIQANCPNGSIEFAVQNDTPGAVTTPSSWDGTRIAYQAFFTAQNTSAGTAIGNNVLHFASGNAAWMVGMPVVSTHPGLPTNATVASIAGGDVTLSGNIVNQAIGTGMEIQIGADTIDGNPTIRGVNETNLTFAMIGDGSAMLISDPVGVSGSGAGGGNWNLRAQGPHYNQASPSAWQNVAGTTTGSSTMVAVTSWPTPQLSQMRQTCSSREDVDFQFAIGSTTANDYAACTLSQGGINAFTLTTAGSAYTNGDYCNVLLTTTTGVGRGVQVNVVVSGGVVSSVTYSATTRCAAISTVQPQRGGINYVATNTLSASPNEIGGTGSGLVVTVASILNVETTTNGLGQSGTLVGGASPTPASMRMRFREPGQCFNGTLAPSKWTTLCRSAAAGNLQMGTVNSQTSMSAFDLKLFGVK